MLGRRAFLAGMVSLVAAPLAGEAQQPSRVPRIIDVRPIRTPRPLTARRGGWYDPALSIGGGAVRLVDVKARRPSSFGNAR